MLHGSGSDAHFVRTAFARPLARAGLRVVAPEDRSGDPDRMMRSLAGLTRRLPDVTVVGGVSIGAHAAARWAAQPGNQDALTALILVMPAWTGQPAATSVLTQESAKTIRHEGVATQLLAMSMDESLKRDWVMEELTRAWPRQADTLAATLLRTSQSRGPLPAELARIRVPVAIVALADDPLHPASVAYEWSRIIPRAAVVEVPRHEPAKGRHVIGAAALTALRKAQRRREVLV